MNLPETNYCKKDTPLKAYHRYDKHMIEQICEYYGLSNPSLKCELYFTREEEERCLGIASRLPKSILLLNRTPKTTIR